LSEPLLLDTHVLIWTLIDSPKLSDSAKRAMSRSVKASSVSVVSVWEIVLKYHTGKLNLRADLDEILDQILYRSSWSILPMNPEHLPGLIDLPPLHKDPFDRLLIAQARYEGMAILTADEEIRKYDVRTVW
jgi:PIN domain nuclease of toxin-antitoxin system